MRNLGATDYVYSIISNVTTDTFDITNAVNSGATSGTAGAYIPAIKVSSVTQTGGDISAVTFAAPSAGNTQLNKINQYSSAQANTITITVPTSLSNGAGGFTSKSNINPIVATVIVVGDSGVSATITPNFQYTMGSNFNQFLVGSEWGGENVILALAF